MLLPLVYYKSSLLVLVIRLAVVLQVNNLVIDFNKWS